MDIEIMEDRLKAGAELFHYASQIDPAIEPRCISWNDYLNCEPASILAEIKRTSVEIV